MYTKALCLCLISATLHGFWNFVLKSTNNKAITLCAGQMIGAFFLMFLSFFLEDWGQKKLNWLPIICLSGGLHAFSLNTLAKAYEKEGISTVLPVSRGTAVTLTAITTYTIFNLNKNLGLLSVLFGLFIINFKRNSIKNSSWSRSGLIGAMLSGVFIASYTIFDKNSIKFIPPVFYASTTSFITATIWALYLSRKNPILFLKIVNNNLSKSILIGLGGVTGYLLVLLALQQAPAYYVLIAAQFSIIVGTGLGVIFLKEALSFQKTIGLILILLGIIFSGL